jgi:4-hydroxybenzoyl-CoA thioesterase
VRNVVYRLTVQFGDCDPAGIVYYPNFYRWFDDASHLLAENVGLGLRALQEQGYVGLPLMQTGATYLRPAMFGDEIEVRSTVIAFEPRRFRIEHRILRGESVLVDGFEVRFLAIRHPDDPKRLRAVDLDEAFRQRFD